MTVIVTLLAKKDGCQHCSVQSLSRVRLFAIPWTAAHQASLSITSSRSLLKLMSVELVMSSNHLILCRPLLLPLSYTIHRKYLKMDGRLECKYLR